MLVVILILSSIFIIVAFSVTENNAKYLLSGYNTMSEEEQQNFDIQSYIPYFKKFHLVLGISLLIVSLLLYYYVDSDWCGIFLGVYPILAYTFFIWKGNQFSKEKNTKQNIKTYIAMGIMLLLLAFIAYEFKSSLSDNEISILNNTITINGSYGTDINLNDVKSIELSDELPKITSKINGFALETVKKGYFSTNKGEKIKLLINSKKSPFIVITTFDNKRIFYTSKNRSSVEIYNLLTNKIKKK